MQMDDILKAAIQDAGLESNLDSILTSHNEYSFFASPPSSNSSTSCYTNYSNKDLNNNDQELLLSDLDFSILNEPTANVLTPSNSEISSSSVSPVSQTDISNCNLMLTDDDDPFLLALKQLDEENTKIEENVKNISNFELKHQTSQLEQKLPNRKIIKINSSSQNIVSYSSKPTSTITIQKPNQPIVRLVSINQKKNEPKPDNDLNNLINFRNTVKPSIPTPPVTPKPTSINVLNKPNNPVKVINLSQLQQKQLQERLISTNACQRIIKIQNNPSIDSRPIVSKPVVPQNNSNIKITKVVPSRPVINYTNNNNVVYFNKTNNKLVHVNSVSNLSTIQKKPVQEVKSQNIVINKTSSVGSNLNNLTKTIPKFYTTPKPITTTITNSDIKVNLPAKTLNNPVTPNTHLSVLNSNLSRLANQNSVNQPSSTPVPTTPQIPINPKFLFNINNSNPNAQTNNNQIPNKVLNNQECVYYEPDEEVVVEEEEELGHAETYANYMPSKLKLGLKHPDPIVETSSLASVEPPDVWYDLKMPSSVYQNGALSALQLEAVVYASQKHTEFLPNSHRCGFLIGDGAGVGKGRTIAGIIYENYLQGRKKALWLSVSNDLKYDAQRDFADIGAENIHVHALNKLKYNKISSAQNSKIKKGVIFSTYSSLIGESQQKSESKKYTSRLKQLLQWLGGETFDGVIVFDECHKAKNLVPVGSAKPTKTGLAVLELQEKLPNARIVYASATGASEPKNMAYMVRLGLWGSGTPFTDFNDFIQSIEKRGVGAMEIVAIDMKLRGMYMARQLSFSGVTFKIEEIPLKNQYIKMYDDSVKLWVEMKERFQEALDLVDQDGKLKKTVWGQFWSSHQRFFKYLCMACKVPYVVDLAKKALSNKKCVVIGLQSTGEARTLEHIDEGGEMNDFVSTARGVLQNLVEKHFPISQNPQHQQKTQNSKLKNSQKVNDIFNRLSSYTNAKTKRKKVSKNRTSSVSSISSLSSLGSSFNESDFLDSDNFDESDFSTDSEQSSPVKNAKKNDLFDFDFTKTETNKKQKSDGFESDDSDSLFSITKCVSVETLINKSKSVVKKSSEDTRKRLKENKKRKKNNEFNFYDNEEDDDEIEEIEPNCEENVTKELEKAQNSESDDDFKLPAKRLKNDEKEEKELEIDDPFGFSISTLKRPNRPKPTKPQEIDEYIHEIKSDLLNTIRSLGRRLPANTLDELIDLLDGPDHVAEMTGRKGRIVSQKDSNNQPGNFVYETRNESDVPVELMNVVQKERFMNGEKLVAIISEAASSGISLQANRRNSNQFRRVHITIELPWSADRAIQQFGRTHRSNQVSAPEYIFLISQLAGEKRFASTVAKRLESLGALTHGDRRATESRDLSRFNIDNKYGRAALENVIKSICNLEKPLARIPKNYIGDFMSDSREALHGVGMIISNKNGTAYPEKDYNNINKFLNRLLGCPVLLQNAIFNFFSDVLAAVILQAKRTGKWDMGILDLGSNNEIANRKETKFYALNNNGDTSRRVEMHTVLVERGMTWEKAMEIYKQNIEKFSETGFYLSNQVKNNHRIAILAVPSSDDNKLTEQKLNREHLALSIYRPNTGLQVRLETPDSLDKKYKKVTPSEVKSHWVEQFHKSVTECTHVYRQGHCSNSRNCDIGLRTRKFYILAGSVLTVWTRVENVLCHLTGSSQFRLQIIRVKTNDNFKIVGCVIPTMCVKQVDSLLVSISSKTFVQNHGLDDDEASKKARMGAQISSKKSSINNDKNTSCSNANSGLNFSNDKNFKTQYLNYDFT